MPMSKNHFSHFAWLNGEQRSVNINGRLELRADGFRFGAVARRKDESFTAQEVGKKTAITAIGKNKVGVDKNHVAVGHTGTEVFKSTIKGVCN